MTRFEIFQIVYKLCRDYDIKHKNVSFLDANMAALTMFCASLYEVEKPIPRTFWELSILEKFQQAHLRLYQRMRSQLLKRLVIWHNTLMCSKDICSDAILFFPTVSNHLDQMIPVSHVLDKRDIKYVYLTNNIEILKELYSKNLFKKSIFLSYNTSHYIDVGIENKIDGLSEIFALRFGLEKSSALIKFLKSRISHFLGLLENLEIITTQFCFNGVVIGNDITFDGRICTRKMQVLKIPTFSIMHGSVSGEPLDSQHIVDFFFVYGMAAQGELRRIGNICKTIVGGAPYLDDKNILFNTNIIHPSIKEKLKLDSSRPFILVLLSGPGHCTTYSHFNKIVSSIFNFAFSHPEYQFVFKLHPKDNLDNYSLHLGNYKLSNIKIVEHKSKGFPIDIFDWFRGVDAILTGASTVAIEAMLLNKKIITIDYYNEYKDVDFIEKGCTFSVKNDSDFIFALDNLNNNIFDESLLNGNVFVKNFFSYIGNSSIKISEIIFNNSLKKFNNKKDKNS